MTPNPTAIFFYLVLVQEFSLGLDRGCGNDRYLVEYARKVYIIAAAEPNSYGKTKLVGFPYPNMRCENTQNFNPDSFDSPRITFNDHYLTPLFGFDSEGQLYDPPSDPGDWVAGSGMLASRDMACRMLSEFLTPDFDRKLGDKLRQPGVMSSKVARSIDLKR